ncbi:hypothetical protein GQ457_07G007790 [Hibiscus cannabinus]
MEEFREALEKNDLNDLKPNKGVISEYASHSYHYYLVIDTIGRQRRNRWRGGSDYFRYDIFWANETECMGKVMAAWSECQGDITDKIKRVALELEDWRKKEEKRDTGKKTNATTDD